MEQWVRERRAAIVSEIDALEEKQRQQRERLSQAKAVGPEWADKALSDQEQQIIISNMNAGSARAKLLADTITRIDAGVYETCVSCGEPIGRVRLDAMPTARQCIDCKKKLEANAPETLQTPKTVLSLRRNASIS